MRSDRFFSWYGLAKYDGCRAGSWSHILTSAKGWRLIGRTHAIPYLPSRSAPKPESSTAPLGFGSSGSRLTATCLARNAMPIKYERVHNLCASDREQPQRAPSPRPVRIEKITWADAELWRSELSQGIYGSMSTTEPVSVRITRFDGALPPTELISNGAHFRRRQAMRRWLVGGSLAALGGLVMVLCLVVAFAGGSGVKVPSNGEGVGPLSQQSASPPLDLGAEQKGDDKGTQKGAAPVVEPKPAITPPPRADPVQATKDGGPDYPQSAPSDPQITIPAPVGCLEAMCEPYVAAIGKRFDDHDNVRLLDCLQRTGMSQGDSKACFLAANLPVSPSRRALYMCGVCKGCIDVSKEEKHELNCEKATAETPSRGKSSDWHQYVPSADGV